MGSITMELWILPVNEADLNPLGEERNEPNKNPFLVIPEKGRDMIDIIVFFFFIVNAILLINLFLKFKIK